MHILAIETSCDETSAAVVENETKVLGIVISSSVETFKDTGGVIPEEAARKQLECVLHVINLALEKAKLTKDDIDSMAVTRGPGLLVSLLVGTTVARTLASLWKKPLIGVHHTLGHLSSTWLDTNEELKFPILTLSASGGHTDLWLRTSHTHGKLLGRTRDDAAGEAFDKGALMLDLGYPGGPAIAKAAEKGNPTYYDFPLPLCNDDSLDFSFSGLKTSLKYLLKKLELETCNLELRPKCQVPSAKFQISDIAASYQNAICKHLVHRIDKAIKLHPEIKEVHLVGGVSANIHLRTLTEEIISPLPLRVPKNIPYCTDNAAMIGAAAAFLIKEKGDEAYEPFETVASLSLNEVVKC
ncbi:tRNA (adenosine(37)-N6)-threonylcarbamoyltransferase complex transferase subunit TsaD [Patescibacteria group bacterium]|nr:tRNA (adenosine(37)-N6)-threonylcarbamoyltransferase complex transferase subunit TsaD [Patescibacteria group bacterium]